MIDMKNVCAAVAVMNEFIEKVKELCHECDKRLADVCPENIAGKLWNKNNQTLNPIIIHLYGCDGSITKDELSEKGFVFQSTDSYVNADFYETRINGIKIVCSMKKE